MECATSEHACVPDYGLEAGMLSVIVQLMASLARNTEQCNTKNPGLFYVSSVELSSEAKVTSAAL